MSDAVRLSDAQLDPLQSPVLQQELPGVKTAFDAQIMRGHLQRALFGEAHPHYTIERCEPGQSVYTGDCCIIRYQLEVDDRADGPTLQPLVIGRVFQDRGTAGQYLSDRLAPLAERMRGRPEMAPFVAPVAMIEALNMVVCVFPIDGELPVLVDVTDGRRMTAVLGEMFRDAQDDGLAIQEVRVELGHYGRQHRCVLRYDVTGTRRGAAQPQHVLVYGKVAADGRGALAGPVIAALHERVLDAGGARPFNVPRSFGFRPDLQLALFEAIPGVPQVAQLLKARLKGEETAPRDTLSLEDSLDACARIAAALHASGIGLGRRRALEDELAGLRQGVANVLRISPELGAQLQSWLERVQAHAADLRPLNPRFSHGDFSYTQLIFEGTQSGLVDFDTVCQAEPALDLGQFLAYLRIAVLKGQKPPAPAAITEQLCARFLGGYIEAMGKRLEDEQRLRARVPVYEIVSLLRLALHSWQKLKGSRLEHVITILGERVSELPSVGSSGRPQEIALWDRLQRFGTMPDWLSAIADSDRVRRALVRGIPEFASGALKLSGCDVGRVRLKKDTWTALCQLTVEPPTPGQQEVVMIRGTLIPPVLAEPDQIHGTAGFGTAGWQCYLPELRLRMEMQPPDAALPALAPLTDPDEARDLLERGIRAGAPAYRDLHIQACTPRIMRYKPGSRCTVLYRLEYAPELAADHNWPEIVVAKTYHGDKGRIAYDGMRALWDSSLAASGAVAVAEPLAFLPEMNVLVQGPIREEQTLQDLLRSALRAGTPQALEELNEYVRKTAVGLAELHRSQVELGELRTWEDELAEVCEVVERLAASLPALADAATPLLERLQALAVPNPADPPVPTHGTFRPAQVLLHKGQIGFIDFDGFCQAEPALDLALFLGKIEDIGMEVSSDDQDEEAQALDREALRAHLAQTKAIGDAFLAEYARQLPVSPPRVALWKALNVLTVVLHSWTKVKPQRLIGAMLMLEQHLREMGLS